MSDEELAQMLSDEPWCNGCPWDDTPCETCLLAYIKRSDDKDILESKRDGFFECSMTDCRYSVKGKCANSCYVDCPYYSLRGSLRELLRKYEEIVVQL